MKRDFNDWLKNFKFSISDYGYYVDFDKVFRNVDNIKVELNILNSLIGSKNIETDFETIVTKYPETLKCIPILLAVRTSEIYARDCDGEYYYSFAGRKCTIEQYKTFMRKTGLFELLSHRLISNLVDYVTGVETGLDSNGRKNRGGHLMENVVECFIQKTGKEYYKEMYLNDIEKKWGINLSALSNNGRARKRFDFVVKTNTMIYGIETNFYGGNGGGSKLNETARSYKMLSQESDTSNGFTFVWITDGTAWKSARRNLEETFDVMEHVYSIDDMEHGILNEVFR
ncbi:MAG: type II restriction endonuclease [Bacteroidales bacterium]|nr:type II restriction endonuclease [Bacteroidales bacterium]